MRVLRGKPVSPGYAEGQAFVYRRGHGLSTPHYTIEPSNVPEEHRRFHQAVERSVQELERLEHRILAQLGREEAEIFSAHTSMLKDEQFAERVRERVKRDLINIEQAIERELEDLIAALSDLEDKYFRERADDIKDVKWRLMRHLGLEPTMRLRSMPSSAVLVARELFPSDTAALDREHVAAIVTEQGGSTGHAAILARSLGIPAITGVHNVLTEIDEGAELLVNGEAGTVTVSPGIDEFKNFASVRSLYDEQTAAALAQEDAGCTLSDGSHVVLLANIGRPEEAAHVREHNLEGVGLFRTEFLFLGSTEPPSQEKQIQAYRHVVQELVGLPVTVRTLDLGGDKQPKFLTPRFERNPALGRRGLRFSLGEKDIFDTQLRAILQATQGESISILFPMVFDSSDFRAAFDHLKTVASELGVDVPPAGALIEAPSALFELEAIAEVADFLSIGTNDLVQYMLAADRQEEELVDQQSVLHPSVLRAIANITGVARTHEKAVSVCGEAAGHPPIASMLVGLGVRALSMSPVRAARVRYALRAADLGVLEDVTQAALKCADEREVKALLTDAGVGSSEGGALKPLSSASRPNREYDRISRGHDGVRDESNH